MKTTLQTVSKFVVVMCPILAEEGHEQYEVIRVEDDQLCYATTKKAEADSRADMLNAEIETFDNSYVSTLDLEF